MSIYESLKYLLSDYTVPRYNHQKVQTGGHEGQCLDKSELVSITVGIFLLPNGTADDRKDNL